MLHKLAGFVVLVTLFAYGHGDVNICAGMADYIFLTDVTNCTNYYICVNQQPILQSCQNSTYFDAATQSCVTTTTQCLNCPANQLVVYPFVKSCNMYVLCFNGEPVIQQCADDLQYDPTTNQCNFAKNVNCLSNQCSIYQSDPNNIVYIPSYAACDTYYICFMGAPVAHTCAAGLNFSTDCNCCTTTSTCSISSGTTTGGGGIGGKTRSINRFTVSENTKPVHVDIDCPPQGVEYRPFEGRENQFFMCLNGKGALMTCAPNLYYDHSIQSCRDLEHIVSFDLDDLYALIIALILASAGTSIAQTAVIADGVNICEGVADYVFLPYVGNCNKYYVCVQEQPIAQSCAAGFLFNAKNQSCVLPEDADCLPDCTDALSSYCYDRTCTKYVLCYGGTPVVSQCCDGLQYNAATDRCDYPQFVDCVDNLCSIYDQDPNDIVYLESKSSCEKYFICYDGTAESQSCSAGLEFNMDCSCCDVPENTNCNITSPMQRKIVPYSKKPPRAADIKCPAEGAKFLPHEESDKYYFCMNGKGVVLECTPGLVFDPAKESCREPKNVKKQKSA